MPFAILEFSAEAIEAWPGLRMRSSMDVTSVVIRGMGLLQDAATVPNSFQLLPQSRQVIFPNLATGLPGFPCVYSQAGQAG